jgi:hypothetical protein
MGTPLRVESTMTEDRRHLWRAWDDRVVKSFSVPGGVGDGTVDEV